jgi:hypothetical protein
MRLKTQQEITNSDNGKTIGDLRLQNGEIFAVTPLLIISSLIVFSVRKGMFNPNLEPGLRTNMTKLIQSLSML